MIRLPKHIHPNDQSQEAVMRRLLHRFEAAQRFPRGFRKFGKKRGITKPNTVGSYVDRLTDALDAHREAVA